MKKILTFLLFLPSIAMAGTLTIGQGGSGSSVIYTGVTGTLVPSTFTLAYQRPRMVYVSSTSLTLSSNSYNGSTSVGCLFPDGQARFDTNPAHIVAYSSMTASLSGTVQGGVAIGTTTINTNYEGYCVKSQANSSDFVFAISTMVPIPANTSYLDSIFGVNSWVPLGLWRVGDNQTAGEQRTSGSFLNGYQEGACTYFTNGRAWTGLSPVPGYELAFSSGAATVAVWDYNPGMGATQVPPNVTFASIEIAAQDLQEFQMISSDGNQTPYLLFPSTANSNTQMITEHVAIKKGLKMTKPFSTGNYGSDISLYGWCDDSIPPGVAMNWSSTTTINNSGTVNDNLGNHVATMTLTAGYGIAGTTVALTQTNTGSIDAMVITSTGTGVPLKVIPQGLVSGGYQNRAGAVTIGDDNPNRKFSSLLVLVDSTTDNQSGGGLLEAWSDNPSHDDPMIWLHNTSNASGPFLRVDDQAPDMEVVNTSTDNTKGLGKWEPMAIAYQGTRLQVNSRAWDNSTFENLAQWNRLSAPPTDPLGPPGLYFSAQTLANDSDVLSSSDTSVVAFTGLNGSYRGITGPQNPTASLIYGLPNSTTPLGQVLYGKNNGRGGNFNVRDWEFTTGGSAGNVLIYTGSAPSWVDSGTTSLRTSLNSVAVSTGVLATQTKCMTIESPTDADNFLFWRTNRAITVTEVDCLVNAATSAALTLQECDANGGTCGTVEPLTCAVTNTQSTAIDDAAIAANVWLRLDVGTVTGTVGHVSFCMTYRENGV